MKYYYRNMHCPQLAKASRGEQCQHVNKNKEKDLQEQEIQILHQLRIHRHIYKDKRTFLSYGYRTQQAEVL